VYEWETKKERVLKFMKIPPKHKLEWLQDMHDFVVQASSEEDLKLRWKLRKIRFIARWEPSRDPDWRR